VKRSEQLAPLSRDHHVALEIALRLRRAEQGDVAAAVARFADYWAEHGADHFEQEERALLPALPLDDVELQAGSVRIRSEHKALRARAQEVLADPRDAAGARALGEALDAHVRYEERELFPLVEERLDGDALDALGRAIAGLRG